MWPALIDRPSGSDSHRKSVDVVSVIANLILRAHLRILTIFTRFGTEKYATADHELDELFRDQFGATRDVIAVDTR